MEFETIVEAIAYHAKNLPDKACLVEAATGRRLTYSEFWRKARVFSMELQLRGLQKGDRVVVRVGSLLETFVAQFGINLAGGVYCPVEKHMKKIKLLELMEYFDSKLLISSERIDFDGVWIELAAVCGSGCPIADEAVFPSPGDMCAIVFTTGTTGRAKGVMLNYKTCLLFGKAWRESYDIDENDVFLWTNPLDRIPGVRTFAPAFISGGTAVHYDGIVFIKDFFNALSRYNITAMYLESSTMAIIMGADANMFAHYKRQIRVMIFSGSFMAESNKRQAQELLPDTRLFIHYGATEASVISYYEFSLYPGKSNCVGKPYRITKVYLLDDEGNPIRGAAGNNLGRIYLESDCMMLGYWKAPDLTNQTLINKGILMTDMGYFDEDGYLYLMGRKDDVIVTGGHKVAPYEIEDIAMQMGGILECACVPVSNRILGNAPMLIVVMKEGHVFSAKEILQYLAERLDSYKMPRIIRQSDALPRVGESNKIDRKMLMEYE